MSKSKNIEGNFIHVVYFWLKNPEHEADRSKFLHALKGYVEHSPFIHARHIGTPASTDRDVIDNTWTFSLILTFPDKAAQDKYQEEDGHVHFVETASPLWERVVVYDSIQHL